MIGWECPKCGAVYAPWVAKCSANHTTSTITSNWPPAVYPKPHWTPPYIQGGQTAPMPVYHSANAICYGR